MALSRAQSPNSSDESCDEYSAFCRQILQLRSQVLDFRPNVAPCRNRPIWHLELDWNWDMKGGNRGQDHSSPEDFEKICGGEVIFDYTPIVHRVRCNGKFLARKQTQLNPKEKEKLMENLKEIRAVKRLNHHHITELCGAYIMGTDLYSLYYPAAEMNLKQYLQLGKVHDPTWVNTIISGMGCLSAAVRYSHDMGVKHKDIHVENILVLGGVLILCDWGASSDSRGQLPAPTLNDPPLFHGRQRGIGRANDVYLLGKLFERMFAHANCDIQKLNEYYEIQMRHGFNYPDSPIPNMAEILQNLTPGARSLSRQDFRCLFGVMTAGDGSERPTTKMVAEYLRDKRYEWAFRFGCEGGEVYPETCGKCCR